ncbi:DNA damage-induced apoptosis suppressor protein [Myripristis murdjan]|uniref:Replication factor A C-terminal domain-containing protein n=1 Tax=Myripristis murdjan TaxID=586833 RepID=A0A667ZMR9_9TELE|nr:DNA damage-induced apoptosis suppressor protein [Myripristis murdjan]
MPVRRALVECAVLSLQDACVFYPCCKGCFSRIDVQQQDTSRLRCPRCGYSCLREQVDYRYRLAVRVARDSHIFGVTVFGNCLNPLFGIHATGLQRLVEDSDEPVQAPSRSTLLLKAVEDCFIGRHFIFGIKVTDTENGPLLGRPVSGGQSAQFIASQIILPKATGQGGCTVVSYYRTLLQKAADCLLGCTDPRPATTLLLPPHVSPVSSLNKSILPASCLLSQSLQSSQRLNPTPPWQQSLGLVTSSAEQEEEGCSTQGSGHESSRQVHSERPPHYTPGWQRGCWWKHELTGERARSPLPSLYNGSSCNNQSFTNSPGSYISKANGNSPSLHTWSSPPQPDHSRTLSLSSCKASASGRAKQSLSTSVAWEDLPFSESLTEFLCKEGEALNGLIEMEPNLIAPNQKETAAQSPDQNSSNESASLCQSNTQPTDALSYKTILLDITNAAALSYDDVTFDQACKDNDGCENRWQGNSVCSHECKQEEKAGFVSLKNCSDEDEHFGEDVYDCSADLFDNSVMISVNTQSPGMQDLRNAKKSTTNMSRCDRSQSLDFVPPSQSTPIVKGAVVSGFCVSTCRSRTSGEFSSQADRRCSYPFHLGTPGRGSENPDSSSLYKLNRFSANRLHQCGRVYPQKKLLCSPSPIRRSHRLALKGKVRKLHNPKQCPATHSTRGRAINSTSTERTSNQCDTSVCDVSVCEENEITPSPTVTKTVGRDFSPSGKERPTKGVNCKRTCLDQTPASSRAGLVQRQRALARESSGSSKHTSVHESNLSVSNSHSLHDNDEACDWSRDLFSDSM